MMPLGSTGSSEDEDNILVHCMEMGGTRRSSDADRISEVEFTKIRDIWGGVEGQIRGSSLKFRFGMRCAGGPGASGAEEHELGEPFLLVNHPYHALKNDQPACLHGTLSWIPLCTWVYTTSPLRQTLTGGAR